jgi:hypothetical protein
LAENGELQIIGTDGKDIVVVKRTGGGSEGGSDGGSDGGSNDKHDRIKVIVNLDVQGGDSGGSKIFDFDPRDVQSIHMVLCDGHDHANIGDSGDGGSDLLVPTFIDGGAGDDHLTGGGGRDTIFGQLGKDKLNGRAGDDLLLGGEDQDYLNGDGGNDVLVGGDGDDKLNGGNGRDVLIGGSGRDMLQGGNDDDLLMGGWTLFDANRTALGLILAEWSSPNDYDARITNSRDGEGAILGGTGVKLAAAGDRTVFDDGRSDTLQGDSGRDWFFADLDGLNGDDDKLKDKLPNERVDLLDDRI